MASHTTKHGQPGVYNSSLPTVPDGGGAALAVDSSGRLLIISAGSSGTSSVNVAQINGVTPLMGNGVSGTGALRVSLASDSTGNIATIGTSVTPGTAAANLGKAEDAAHTTGDTGVMLLAVRNDTNAIFSGADGDYTPIQVSSSGRPRVEVHAIGTAAGDLGKAEDAAHSSGDAGVMLLGVRNDSFVALSGTDMDYTPIATDSAGRIITRSTGLAADNAAASGNPLRVAGRYNSATQTYDNGDSADLQVDVNGYLKSVEQYAPAYEDNTNAVAKVEQRFSYLNIAAGQATTVVKSGAGFLHSITFNSAATATNVTTVYDNTAGSGTVIAIPAATTATVPVTLTYDVSFATGLTILTATANGSNMTVSYR